MRYLAQILITLVMLAGSTYSIAQCGGPVPMLCDADGDYDVDSNDISAIGGLKGMPSTGPGDLRDVDGDGMITVLDARQCVARCDKPQCADAPDLSLASMLYSDTPAEGLEITVSLVVEGSIGDVDWSIESLPDMSNQSLVESSDHKSITFVGPEPGDYRISARSLLNGTERQSTFSIVTEFPFDELKVVGNESGSLNLSEVIAIISNQSWVYSTSLSEGELRDIVNSYGLFVIIGYDDVEGLLIEYDETDAPTIKALEEMNSRSGVAGVVNRVHEGKNADRSDLITPNDGSGFSDGGDNWHLEKIGATRAWDFSTGSDEIRIGISDAGYDTKHIELQGRFYDAVGRIDVHGNGVAGAIIAVSDNKVGMSGINWVSQGVLVLNGKDDFGPLLRQEKVVTTNSSWSIPGYLESTFDPEDPDIVSDRDELALKSAAPYRKMAVANPDKLIVWAAGNGIGNGSGNSDGVYGVDGRHHSPALHYNSDGVLQKQDNVIFVAAMRDDNRLAYYSNYGESVDIAAPTSFKSLSTDGGYSEGASYGDGISGFTGTSAATPVVTGVASLIYSLYPGFTGAEVKSILIDASTESVTERHFSGIQSGVETLDHPIPILNAGAALEKAQQIVDSKVAVSHVISNPFFLPQATLSFRSIDESLDIVGMDWELQTSLNAGGPWSYESAFSQLGASVQATLNAEVPFHRIVADITLRDKNDEQITTSAHKEYEFSYSVLGIITKSASTQDNLSGVQISVEPVPGQLPNTFSYTDDFGFIQLHLSPGTYKIRGYLAGYQEAVDFATINGLQSQQMELNMTLEGITPPPPATFPLNDTGITFGGDYPSGNNWWCTGITIAQQDCSHGRDVNHNDDSDGWAGFSYTKLSSTGAVLPANAVSWACVRDNVTGLVWEMKTYGDGSIHDKDNTYRWGGKTAQGSGYGDYYPDWDVLVDGSNAEALCGFTDWRVPTRHELQSIVNYSWAYPAIDNAWFPNTRAQEYWSASPDARYSYGAWSVRFLSGSAQSGYHRSNSFPVRLVRAGL